MAVSIAEPPPTASSPSAAAGSSIRSEGTSDQWPTGASSTTARQRGLATRNGRSIPSSASTAGSSASDQRTITGARPRANSTNARAARVSARPLARTRKISRSSSSPSTRASASVPAARSASIEEREMKVTP